LTNPYPLDLPVNGWQITFTVTQSHAHPSVSCNQQKFTDRPTRKSITDRDDYLRQHHHAGRMHPWERFRWCHRTDLQLNLAQIAEHQDIQNYISVHNLAWHHNDFTRILPNI
jgi:hypothetical protein